MDNEDKFEAPAIITFLLGIAVSMGLAIALANHLVHRINVETSIPVSVNH